MSLQEFILDSVRPQGQGEIIFFGGSFNPWHQGHESCIKLLKSTDSAIIIVVDQNPHKQALGQDERSHTQSIREFIGQQKQENLFLYTGFIKHKRPNPTSVWITKLREQLPQLKLSFLMGFDSFQNISQWHQHQKLLASLYRLYIASRKEDAYQRSHSLALLKESSTSIPEIFFLGHHDHEEISSSSLRHQKS